MYQSDLNTPATQMVIWFVLSGNRNGALDSLNSYNTRSEGSWYKKWSGQCFIWLEEYDSARFYLESSLKSGDPQMLIPRFQSYLAFANFKTHNYREAWSIINKLINKSKEASIGSPEYFLGWYYSGTGQVDSAFYWLEKACQNRSAEMPWLKVDPVFKNLKGDKRYWDLYERTGHKAYDDYIKSTQK
jgi:tetratricopeptide (TPR) repeat protein